MLRPLIHAVLRNPVFLNLVFVVVCLAGVIAYVRMPKEEFPVILTDRVAVGVIFPGASPEDVEDLVVRPIEDALDGLDGLKHLYADSLDGRAFLLMEFVRGTDVDEARDEVQRRVDALEMPDQALPPGISVASQQAPVLMIALTGDTRQVELAESLADELLAMPGVREIFMEGMDERRLAVVLDPPRAAALGVSPLEVAKALDDAALGAPAGEVQVDGGGVLVRTVKGIATPDDLVRVPLRSGDGVDLRVGDVAHVEEDWARPLVRMRVHGQPAINLRVLRQDDADNLVMVPEIAAWAEARRDTLPAGLDLVVYDDSARIVRDRLQVLGSNGLVGVILVGLCLILFIGLRNALLVVWGLPVAFLGAIAVMHGFGVTINVVSTFGLLLVTGILVDDAVVVVENVQRHLEMGKDRVRAALDGTVEVAGAVTSATITTCLAFAPLLMLEGTVGRIMSIIPTVVILSLLASLFEAFFVLPGHLGHHAEERPAEGTHENLPTRLLKSAYAPLLDKVTMPGRRGLLLGVLFAVVFGAIGLSATMRTSLTTAGLPLFAFVDVDLQPTADLEATEDVLRDVERFAFEEAGDLITFVSLRAGEQYHTQDLPTWGARHGQLKIGFHNDEDVLAQVPAFLDRVRAHLDARPDVAEHGIATLTGGPPAGKDIDVRVRGLDADAVESASADLEGWLRARPAVRDIRRDLGAGATAWEVRVEPARAARFGLTEATVTPAVRAALDGLTALEMPVRERTTEVRVSIPTHADRAAVEDLPVILPGVGAVRLRQVATVSRVQGAAKLSRVDGQRSIRLTAEVDDAMGTSADERRALDAAFSDLPARYAGASLFYGGELADTADSFAQLPTAGLLALCLVYFVLAVQFRSYVQPIIILAAVPLGAAGVVLGLFTLRMELSFIAMIGAVGLVGIVVNDSLVLVDFINLARAEGKSARDAVIEASLTRLRPILITTVTTVLGLLPLALGLAGEDPLLAPMAVSIAFGLSFATALTLVVVPVLYLVLDDLSAWATGRSADAG